MSHASFRLGAVMSLFVVCQPPINVEEEEAALLWEELRHNDLPALQFGQHTASMAGDSETHLRDRDENTNIIRQPFLIGVSGGTASGKVSTPANSFVGFRELSRSDFELKSRQMVSRQPAAQ